MKVSVCIPVYNGARYLGEAINSVLNQSFADFELIVIDDCSTDRSDLIIRSFNDQRLRYEQNTVRLGLVENWNRCLKLSNGEYVCIFHQDDVMAPENLEKKVRALNAGSQVGLAFSAYEEIDSGGNLIGKFPVDDSDRDRIQNGLKSFEHLFSGINIIGCPTVVARRECYDKLGGFDSRLPLTCDWEMWLRIALFYQLAYVDEPLLRYRWHDGNETNRFVNNLDGLKQNFLAKSFVLDKFPQQITREKELRRKIKQEFAVEAVEQASHQYSAGRHELAKDLLRFSFQLHPGVITKERFIRTVANFSKDFALHS